jgi:hypothetical protein
MPGLPISSPAVNRARKLGRSCALLAPVARKSCWQMAEVVGEDDPQSMQRLLYSARWEADEARDELQRSTRDCRPDGPRWAASRHQPEWDPRLGPTPEELIGHNVHAVLPPDLARTGKARIDQVFRSGEPILFEDSRTAMHLAKSVYPVYDERGERVTRVRCIQIPRCWPSLATPWTRRYRN